MPVVDRERPRRWGPTLISRTSSMALRSSPAVYLLYLPICPWPMRVRLLRHRLGAAARSSCLTCRWQTPGARLAPPPASSNIRRTGLVTLLAATALEHLCSRAARGNIKSAVFCSNMASTLLASFSRLLSSELRRLPFLSSPSFCCWTALIPFA